MELCVYIAVSLDGFIAREDGELDWLPGSDGMQSGEDYGFQEFLDSVDALVMGRHTFETVISFGQWPYGTKKVIVLSSHEIKIPENIHKYVEVRAWSPHKVVDELRKDGVKKVYVDGGKTIQGFLRAGLITEMTITRVPILLGKGIQLFGFLDSDIQLKHIETRSFENGLVQSKYEVIR